VLFIFQLIIVLQFTSIKRLVYAKYTYPVWSEMLGWMFVAFEVSFIPILAIYAMWKHEEKLPLFEVNETQLKQ